LALIALLAALEFRFPQFPRDAERARRWPTNFGLAIVNALMASSTPVLTIWSAHWAAGQGVGLFNWMAAPWWLAWPGTLLARSLAQYAIHVAAHKIPILWRLHRVHHCDVHLDVSSALRAHPLDMIASIAFMIPLVVLSGMSPVVLVVYESVEIVVIVLTHANMRVPRAADRCARALFVTPSLHRLHHSPDRVETDSNFGNVFTFWDRLFGTYRGEPIRADDRFQFGLDDVSREHASDFGHQLRLPWI
ncbi:MAG: sterol desaturase family protein, partial [Proteobacteria bacterium]|nr:sterol desaturase family protein [Pseudomonadota bacterium]